jgi:hypothetical protein
LYSKLVEEEDIVVYIHICINWNRGSSVSIVSDYGLDDRAIGVRSPAGAKYFSSNLSIQTSSGAHPASCTMDTGGPFPGGKARPGRDADHSPLSSAEVKNEYELYLLSLQTPPWHIAGLLCFIYINCKSSCNIRYSRVKCPWIQILQTTTSSHSRDDDH